MIILQWGAFLSPAENRVNRQNSQILGGEKHKKTSLFEGTGGFKSERNFLHKNESYN